MKERERWMKKNDEKNKLMKLEWKTNREKKAYLRDRWQRGKYGKEKEGKSKEKAKERRQSKRGREKINNLEKTKCHVTHMPYQ
jgi:hypothetical protein